MCSRAAGHRAVRQHRSICLLLCSPALLLLLLACGEGGGPLAGGTLDEGAAAAQDGLSSGLGSTDNRTSGAEVPLLLDLTDPPSLGEGFVVWESNRSSAWRLWQRSFDGSTAQQLTFQDGPRQHCCAHISPDGQRLAYLSLPKGAERYPMAGASGELRLLELDGGDGQGEAQILATEARTYFEHRAAVWRDDRLLLYIDGEGRTQEIDLETGSTRLLVREGPPGRGWLLDPNLRFAVEGTPRFSPYDASQQAVRPEPSRGGCQAYFTQDGRYGFWLAGAGGPIRALDMDSGLTHDLLRKGDHRLPADWDYLYFPMLSADNAFLVWGASDGTHDHTRADYEIFLAEIDPQRMQVVNNPRRVSSHAATDRFPAVWARPQVLGRHSGEAPLRLEMTAQGEGWRWDFGDGSDVSGESTHTYAQAGRYAVVARRNGEELHGTVQVAAPEPPTLRQTNVRDNGLALWLHFDEPVELTKDDVRLDSGIAIVEANPEGDSSWRLRLAEPLGREDTLRLRGITDRAQRPNSMADTAVPIVTSRWPADRRGLIFLWQAGDRRNLVQDPVQGGEHATLLEPVGPAWLDRHFAMVTRGGAFIADLGTMDRLYHGARQSNELSLEMTVEAATIEAATNGTAGDGDVFAFGDGNKLNASLSQESGRWIVRWRTSSSSRSAPPPLDLGAVVPGQAQHLVVTYTPGHLRGWLDGQKTVESSELMGGFFPWKRRTLSFGRQWPERNPWHGRIWGVAAWQRELSEEEVAENLRRSRLPPIGVDVLPPLRLRGTLLAKASLPTLEDISPYREALAVFEYRVDEVLQGDFNRSNVRVVHRVWLDGEKTAISRLPVGQSVSLDLQPFLDQPQLESLYLSQNLPTTADGRLFFSDRIRP